jgi:hypothetical protein
MAAATSCSYAVSAAAPRACFMLGTFLTAFGFSLVANALGLLISSPWAIGGIALLVG